ncbi:MAG: TrkH family potassium uptake protein [Deltaproteobacteria bacterium]|nr:TrkH family potassium uptake protein [Deltaproteobacteria bacterium]
MNVRRVLWILGLVLYVLAAAQLVPLLWCLFPFDPRAARGFLVGAATSALLATAFRWRGTRQGELYRRDGVLIVVGTWLFASLIGAIPYVASGAIPNPIDALFESVSGFTTTGASILTDVEVVPRAVLFWRGFTQWLGGVGLVVIFVALLSELGPGARMLIQLEVPGPKAEILHARVQQTAIALFRIYLALTVAQTVVMIVLGASPFDALVHAFTTISTGGFSSYNASLGHFSGPIQLVVTLFMLASGLNFSLYYILLRRRDLRALRDPELRAYLAIVAGVVALIVVDLAFEATNELSLLASVHHAAFSVASVMTTTGFMTVDFDRWPGTSRWLLVALMFVGACAGSTAGGIKVIRVLVAWAAAMREVRLTFSPNSVVAVMVGAKPVAEESIRAVMALVGLWFLAWIGGTVLLTLGDVDIVTASTAAISTLSNVGPGLGRVGPAANYAFFSDAQTLVMVLLMWLGRLEFFAVLALFDPRFWRR